jgi:hypothetical protein
VSGEREQIGEGEAVAQGYLAVSNFDRPLKHGSAVGEGVKLPTLAAGVDAARKLGQQRRIELSTYEACLELFWIHTGETRS